MKKKIIDVLVCLLITATAFLPISGAMNVTNYLAITQIENIQNQEFVSEEFIIKIKKDTSFQSPSLILLEEKFPIDSIEQLFKNSEDTTLNCIYILKIHEKADIPSIVKEYSFLPEVVYAEPSYKFRSCISPINTQQIFQTFNNELVSN